MSACRHLPLPWQKRQHIPIQLMGFGALVSANLAPEAPAGNAAGLQEQLPAAVVRCWRRWVRERGYKSSSERAETPLS